MFHYRVTISYKGTNYRGWQAQSKDEEPLAALPTVQGTIHQVLKRIAKHQECTIAGTSRTDAGVHAQGQVGKVSLPVEIAADKLMQGMNSLLPTDIRILKCERCAEDFNPKTSPTTKEYHYYFSSRPVANPVLGDLVAHIPGPLDMELMAEAAQLFVGEHDFQNFYRRNSLAATTLRRVHRCTIENAEFSPMGEEVFYLKITGNGFLKQMVRYIAGTLFEVARGKLSLAQISGHLAQRSEDKLCPKAKAHGLHLVLVEDRPPISGPPGV